ncbi:MAG: hypothetical protein HZC25_08860 [Rhodospirillales bacterium]|nr:hypothetical protein [Rhodospirillales bacterium]
MTATNRQRFDEPLRAVPLSPPPPAEQQTVPRRINLIALERWIERAARGDVIEYHRGHLANDRFPGHSALTERQYRELGQVAERMAVLAAEGRVVLAQKRIDTERVAYLAIRAAGPSSHKPF